MQMVALLLRLLVLAARAECSPLLVVLMPAAAGTNKYSSTSPGLHEGLEFGGGNGGGGGTWLNLLATGGGATCTIVGTYPLPPKTKNRPQLINPINS